MWFRHWQKSHDHMPFWEVTLIAVVGAINMIKMWSHHPTQISPWISFSKMIGPTMMWTFFSNFALYVSSHKYNTVASKLKLSRPPTFARVSSNLILNHICEANASTFVKEPAMRRTQTHHLEGQQQFYVKKRHSLSEYPNNSNRKNWFISHL